MARVARKQRKPGGDSKSFFKEMRNMVEYTKGQQIIIKIMAKSGLTHLFLYHLLWLLSIQLSSCSGDLTL